VHLIKLCNIFNQLKDSGMLPDAKILWFEFSMTFSMHDIFIINSGFLWLAEKIKTQDLEYLNAHDNLNGYLN
jgi:hypothetical protein